MKDLADHDVVARNNTEHNVVNFIDDSNFTLIFHKANTVEMNQFITAYIYLM